MCGLVGVASNKTQSSRRWLIDARDAMAHRGPDAAGEWWSGDGRVGLAHRRLSIIDTSNAGNQPMHMIGHGLSIVFNGEIYNYKELRSQLKKCGYNFQSNSDTEVLLAAYDAWGVDCIKMCNGMFAFAIFDEHRNQLFLARDRVGEKPLFFHINNGSIYFASELKALMANPALPRRIDAEALDCYLAMGYVPGSRCILKGYNKLAPAHAMTFDIGKGEIKIWRYWQLPEFNLQQQSEKLDEVELLNELDGLLESAVGRQLVADVPVGVLLSGGVDSSIVTAMAVRRSSQVLTFSIGFPGHGKLDETFHARLIARHFGTKHTELMADSNVVDLIPILAHQFDEPIVDSSIIPTWLVSNLVSKHCKVVLGGDGGDELFAGYQHYSRLLWLERNTKYIPSLFKKNIASIAAYLLPAGFKGKSSLESLPDLNDGLPSLGCLFDARMRSKLMGHKCGYGLMAENIRRGRIYYHSDLLERATRLDFTDYLAEDILVKVDRASMLNSLEVRSPFLDYQIAEFAFGRVPTYLKADSRGNKKILLKRLAKQILPSGFDFERKQGFSIPMSNWLQKKGSFYQFFMDVLTQSDCIFDRQVVQDLFDGQTNGYNNGERLFGLVMFELWRKDYGAVL